MQDFIKAFKLESKNKQLEFNIPHRKKNIFLRYPRTGFITGLLFMMALEFLLTDMTFSGMVLVTVATCAFMSFLWFLDTAIAPEKVFLGPAFLLSVLAAFAVRGLIVLSDDVFSLRIEAIYAFNMFLFSLICFSIVFIFKVKKAITTGKLKWNQEGYTYDPLNNANPAELRTNEARYKYIATNIYSSRISDS
jgi:hypothetical protein